MILRSISENPFILSEHTASKNVGSIGKANECLRFAMAVSSDRRNNSPIVRVLEIPFASLRLRRNGVAQPPPHVYFVGSAVFHYLGPSFAVLLFARVDVLGVAWLRIAAAAAGLRALATSLANAARSSTGAGGCWSPSLGARLRA